MSWAILTGEYPPASGGVADYTRLVARGLANAGDEVDVFAPPAFAPHARDPGVTVHTLPDHWGPRGVRYAARELARRPAARVLVEYVPHAYGMKAMNLPFVAWLASLRRPFWVMFHEVAFRIRAGDPLKHNAIGAVTKVMAALLATRAERAFVSIPQWGDHLRRLAPWKREAAWLPVPSNVGLAFPEAVGRARERFGLSPTDIVVAHFGTYGVSVAPLLAPALRALLGDRKRVGLLLGRGGPEFAQRELGQAAARVIAPGELPDESVAALLATSSVAVQPYADGVSSRRGSVMAALALGVPVATNGGAATEAVWRDEHAVLLARASTAEAIAAAAEALLGDPVRSAAIGASGRALYERAFSVEQTVRTLRAQ